MLPYFHNSIIENFGCKVSFFIFDYWHCFSLFNLQIERQRIVTTLRRYRPKLNYLLNSKQQIDYCFHDDAFVSLDEALKHARALEELLDGKEHFFTAPLVTFVKCKTDSWGEIAETLPEDWPFWCNPDYSQVEKEIKADPRWEKWVNKCRAK